MMQTLYSPTLICRDLDIEMEFYSYYHFNILNDLTVGYAFFQSLISATFDLFFVSHLPLLDLNSN